MTGIVITYTVHLYSSAFTNFAANVWVVQDHGRRLTG